jgi:Protein of unknown function (DUF1493)
MADDRDTIFNEIAAELSDQTGLAREAVLLRTRLCEDLDFWGNDVYEFLEWYVSRFNVDLTGFSIRNHFRERGFDLLKPLHILGHLALEPSLRDNWKRLQAARSPITVEHLVKCAQAGRWRNPLELDPTLDNTETKRLLNPLTPRRLAIAIVAGVIFILWILAAAGALFGLLASTSQGHTESDPWVITAAIASLAFLTLYVAAGWGRAGRSLKAGELPTAR